MKTQYVASDGKVFNDKDDCRLYESRMLGAPTAYAVQIKLNYGAVELTAVARDYAKWLRAKQNYPATDSGEHKCCDLMEEMASRLT